MKLLESGSTDTAKYPATSNNAAGPVGPEFMQLSLQECIGAVMRGLTNAANAVFIVDNPTMFSYNSGTDTWTVTAGWVWYIADADNTGELFYVPAQTIAMSGKRYLNPTVDGSHSSGDPTTFSDGNPYYVHAYRQIVFTAANSPSTGAHAYPSAPVSVNSFPHSLITTLPDALDGAHNVVWATINSISKVTIKRLAANTGLPGSMGALSAGTLTFTTPNDGITHYYRMTYKAYLTTSGSSITSAGTFKFYNLTDSSNNGANGDPFDSTFVGKQSGQSGDVYSCHVGLEDFQPIAPNKTIEIYAQYDTAGCSVSDSIFIMEMK